MGEGLENKTTVEAKEERINKIRTYEEWLEEDRRAIQKEIKDIENGKRPHIYSAKERIPPYLWKIVQGEEVDLDLDPMADVNIFVKMYEEKVIYAC